MAEDVFKNIQVLKGIPVKEFMNTMGFFSASTGLNCIDCHSPQAEELAGYASLSEQVPIDIYAKAPNQLTSVVHTQSGDSVTTINGSSAWVAAADKLMRVLPLIGGDLEGAQMDAILSFPAGLKQQFQWRTG